MKAFRKVLFWCHLTAGITAGTIVLVMSVTGVVLTYQRQMQWWADTRHFRAAPPPDAQRLPPSGLVAAVLSADTTATPATIAIRRDASQPAVVVSGTRTLYVNPYTAQVYGEGEGRQLRTFLSSVTSWHRWLATSGDQRTTGRAITGASNLLFLGLVLSGFYLWWPRSWTWGQFKNVLWFKRRLSGKARDFNWHNTIGFWSAIPLAVIVYSGVVMSYPWANNMAYRLVGDQPPAAAEGGRGGGEGGGRGRGGGNDGGGRGAVSGRRGGEGGDTRAEVSGETGRARGAGQGRANEGDMNARPMPSSDGTSGANGAWSSGRALDLMFERSASTQPDWTILTLRVPTSPRTPATVTVDRGDGGQPQRRGTLTLNAATGEVTKWEPFSNQTPGRRFRSWLRFAHTGEAFGSTGQTIAGLASAGAVFLVYTGFALAWRRFRNRKRAPQPLIREPARHVRTARGA